MLAPPKLEPTESFPRLALPNAREFVEPGFISTPLANGGVARDQWCGQTSRETSVLFELIAARYERRSMLITANQPFGEWGKIFPDQAMTLAAIDRLVHHSTILEMNVESYRRREALDRKRGPGRPPVHATTKNAETAKN